MPEKPPYMWQSERPLNLLPQKATWWDKVSQIISATEGKIQDVVKSKESGERDRTNPWNTKEIEVPKFCWSDWTWAFA